MKPFLSPLSTPTAPGKRETKDTPKPPLVSDPDIAVSGGHGFPGLLHSSPPGSLVLPFVPTQLADLAADLSEDNSQPLQPGQELSFADFFNSMRPSGHYVSSGAQIDIERDGVKLTVPFAEALRPMAPEFKRFIIVERPRRSEDVATLKDLGAEPVGSASIFKRTTHYAVDLAGKTIRLNARHLPDMKSASGLGTDAMSMRIAEAAHHQKEASEESDDPLQPGKPLRYSDFLQGDRSEASFVPKRAPLTIVSGTGKNLTALFSRAEPLQINGGPVASILVKSPKDRAARAALETFGAEPRRNKFGIVKHYAVDLSQTTVMLQPATTARSKDLELSKESEHPVRQAGLASIPEGDEPPETTGSDKRDGKEASTLKST